MDLDEVEDERKEIRGYDHRDERNESDDSSGSKSDDRSDENYFGVFKPYPDEIHYDEELLHFEPKPKLEVIRPPDYTANMSIPRSCETPYKAYETSTETHYLISEALRTEFPDLFVKDKRLGLLSELCVRALAKANFPLEYIPNLQENPHYVEIYYEEVPLGMTIERTLPIDNEIYWKRLVLENHPDKSIALRENMKWKNVGISLMLASKVEDSPVEYWDEDEIAALAELICYYVTELSLHKLKSQTDATFDRYYENAENEDWASSEDSDGDFIIEEEATGDFDGPIIVESDTDNENIEEFDEDEVEADHIEEASDKRDTTPPPPPEPPKRKKKKKTKGLSIMDIEVEDSYSTLLETELEEEKCDRRNMEKYLNKIRNFNYPTKICHHIDLSFIGYFHQIQEFNLSFSGDGMIFNYHEKHLKFSYRDMDNLAKGLRSLYKLRIFRFTRSRMDKKKLRTIVKALMYLPCLEIVDFRLDHLKDNCGKWFHDLIVNSTTLRSLELESNELSTNVMRWIGSAFHRHEGSTIEYLGLARNPVGDAGLRYLFKGLQGTRHVQHLNLTGISCSSAGIFAIADELIAKHQYLRHLILVAINISPQAADRLVNALIKCTTLLEIDVRCCNLDHATELDIAIIQKRNEILSLNVMDVTASLKEIQNWFKRVKHPLLLRIINDIHRHLDCLREKHPEFELSEKSISGGMSSEATAQSEHTLIDDEPANPLCVDSESSSFCFPTLPKHERLLFNYENLTQEQFVHYASTGGPENRFAYHRSIRKRHVKVDRRRQHFAEDQYQRISFD